MMYIMFITAENAVAFSDFTFLLQTFSMQSPVGIFSLHEHAARGTYRAIPQSA